MVGEFNGKTLIGFLLLQITDYGTEMGIVRHLLVLSFISYGAAVSLRKQLEHVVRRKLENQNYGMIGRRFFADPMAPSGSLLGVPSMPSHLPEAEPILPGHTLLRPALGMLKSAVKFPHRDLENGAGVYGNIDSLGMKYDGVNERILYTGFRRMPSEYILIVPQKSEKNKKQTFVLGAPISVRSDHFYTDPQDDNEINENRLETQRAIQDFFQKAREGLINSQKNRNSIRKKQFNPKPKFSFLSQKTKLRLHEDSSSSVEDQATIQTLVSAIHSSKEDKKTWFAKSKNAFTHINIDSDAPEHGELLPLTQDEIDEIRKWWYYNQDDFEPFDEKEMSQQFKPDEKINGPE